MTSRNPTAEANMYRQLARVVEEEDVRALLDHTKHQRHPTRNRVMVLLSFKNGLRAAEISGLRWTLVTTTRGRISDELEIARDIAKMGSSRRIPMHPELRKALAQLHAQQGHPKDGPVIRSERGGRLTPESVVNWFGATYRELGMIGCSSHSGRRTFITNTARALAVSGGSLRDIQLLSGHKRLETVERYVAPNRASLKTLISLV
jgi:integrase